MAPFIERNYEKIKKKYTLSSPKELLKEADIDLLPYPLDMNTGGFTTTNQRCSTIVVNSNWDEHYLGFVILHEFSHLVLHGGTSTPYYRRIGSGLMVPKIEHEANELAIKLLLDMHDKDEIKRLTKSQLIYYLGIDEDLLKYIPKFTR
ncbi:toxin-antitoxin system toxin subunit [Limosilactobacillus reuteri]|uniref:Toxin-antitoxin system toxin subunit n=1 Tax=Limosilactobacillus reuteri TaxID=1598 RepID=A0A1C2G9N3_LIMRT|nr:ImmA/IrrE family metallo-endopeptidase [Limosilactobacillus reuteri]MCC4332694.1 ImmA/IrrE family metallo-endopeptidase [Limosilactobacillus reuteri]MCC4353772.1 ImmA/IrrE family metallo-endopeptidase [Limosilactobacillus reuteri]OCX48167.1 toxin-antitoxin system toxin subunit [Limosilactobacillus reuteri]OUL53402.1 toxin-antitoxin system toxin subunit [Limosilactobacillus reuteri]WPC93129.1 ImmA/IrrE family metallo-endopeptidase [Limosilactobacillus reuteri]